MYYFPMYKGSNAPDAYSVHHNRVALRLPRAGLPMGNQDSLFAQISSSTDRTPKLTARAAATRRCQLNG